jgi:Ca2+-binding RTX toxin-like protein
MGSLATRSCSTATLCLALLWGASCVPSGAKFSPATGVLTVYGTANGDVRIVSVAAGGSIVVNGGQIPITGGVPTVANTVRIEMRGREGADFLELDEGGGPLPGGLLLGGPGADVLIGGSGDDEIDGGAGDDVALLGDGEDTFVWLPGGGTDRVEGEAGIDTLRFHGDDAAANATAWPSSGRVSFFEDVAGVTADLDGVETIEYLARGGADTVLVSDMSGTDLTRVVVDLSATAGGGDAEADTITVNGTQGSDGIGVAAEAGGVHVFGLLTNVHVVGQEPASDRLIVNAQSGDDVVDASGLGGGAIRLAVNGGLGGDDLVGSEDDDLLSGGDGNDFVHMGEGDDTFVWSPGDDNDTLDGEDGFDTLLFNGANVSENIDVSAVGGRVRFFRNIANVALDLGSVEAVDFLARGGADIIVVNDLSGTDLLEVHLDLAASIGGGDAQPDGVIVVGTVGADTVQIFGDASEVAVVGLPASVFITTPENALDSLTIGTLAGEDLVYAAGLTTPSLLLTADGGDHDDVLIGGDGGDVLMGGDGDDVLQGGPGLDVLDGGAGDNIVIQ